MDDKQPCVRLNILPVGSGDCIHLRFRSSDGKWRNIVVDSGPAAAKKEFRSLLEQIESHGEKIDLLCFSHIDNDHINGAKLMLTPGKVNPGLVTQICMNIPDEALPAPCRIGDFLPTGVSEASMLLQNIVNLQIPCRNTTVAGDSVQLGDAEVRVVLPTWERLNAYYEHCEESGGFHNVAVHQDADEVNGSSIALLFTLGSCRILLTGDAFSKDLAEVGEDYAGEQGFSMVKLPHHGSAANITAEMLQRLKTREFIISTRQNDYRPAEKTMELLSQYGGDENVGGVTVYGNYEWSRFAAGVPNVKIIHPEEGSVAGKNGIEVYADGNSRRIFG